MIKFWGLVIVLGVLLLASLEVPAHYHDGGRIGTTFGAWIGGVYHICTYVTPVQVVCQPG